MLAIRQGVGALLVAAALVGAPVVSWAGSGQPWILVDTRALTLTVLSGENHTLARFKNISIGSGGTAEIHRRGDETTPLGVFHIAWVDRHSRYDIFYGIDYPSANVARRAYLDGMISGEQLDAILDAFEQHRIPPQDTPLGGRLGIHGLGSGDLHVHKALNWTDGCVAVTNPQIRQLSRWIRLGTRVVIR